MSGYLILIIFLGLIFGSLGSVVMTRFSDGITRKNLRGFFFGRSECPQCKHTLHAKNLVPVLSYLTQKGRCNFCGKKISRTYPVLELITAVIFVLTYFFLKDFGTPTLIFGLVTNRLLVLLLVYDLKTYELHMIVRILLGIFGICTNIFATGGNIQYAFLSAMVFGVVFTGIYFFGKWYAKIRFNQAEGFGQGDVYLAVTIGLFVPIIVSYQGIFFSWWILINVLILFTLLSSILGLLGSGIYYIFGTLKMENEKLFSPIPSTPQHIELRAIPFFPAMIVAFWIIARQLPRLLSIIFTPLF